jgi:hypothetical protein
MNEMKLRNVLGRTPKICAFKINGIIVELTSVARNIVMKMVFEARERVSGLVKPTIATTNTDSRMLVTEEIIDALICIPLVKRILDRSCAQAAPMILSSMISIK